MFIDDSPNLTMMEIRAKARRLKQRHDLRLVVIDYIQLMTSGKKVESRQLEVSEFSRQLKLLAKELDVPVVALVPAQPWPRTAHRQAADAVRPSRVRQPRAGRRRGDPAQPSRSYDRIPSVPARPTSMWPSTATARRRRSPSPSRVTTPASPTCSRSGCANVAEVQRILHNPVGRRHLT